MLKFYTASFQLALAFQRLDGRNYRVFTRRIHHVIFYIPCGRTDRFVNLWRATEKCNVMNAVYSENIRGVLE